MIVPTQEGPPSDIASTTEFLPAAGAQLCPPEEAFERSETIGVERKVRPPIVGARSQERHAPVEYRDFLAIELVDAEPLSWKVTVEAP
ncbi:MAG: hypothetical protein ACREMB_24620 [Candidatus Rokuibacteriota bacterium]